MQLYGKIGFILLQSCDGCKSHQAIIDKAMSLLAMTTVFQLRSEVYVAPLLPLEPQKYEGLYTAMVGTDKREARHDVN